MPDISASGVPLRARLEGGGTSVRSFIHIRDVADATMRICRCGTAGGIYHLSTDRRDTIRALVEVEIEQTSDGLGCDLRRVTGQHNDMVIGRKFRLRHHQSVASAALLGLEDEIDARIGHRGADAPSFVSDDGVEV